MPDSRWTLIDFEYHLDIWIRNFDPTQELINEVGAWILSRFDDPYQGMRREPGFENLWYGPVPGTMRGGEQVTCSYMIVESAHTVHCRSIATLSVP